MADQGPSIADIQRARNQKQSIEAGSRPNTDKVAAELQKAHEEAERLKNRLGDSEAPSQTQAFPHGAVSSTPQGETMTDKIQNAQADLYSNVAEKASNLGETIKGSIASADQATTTNLRDTTAAAAGKLSEAGNTAATAAAEMYTKAKETVKGALGMGGESGSGGAATAYEGVVFGSDDPEYRQDNNAGRATENVSGGGGGGVDHAHKVAVEVDNKLEAVDQELESEQPATDQIMGKLGATAVDAAMAEAPAGSDPPPTDIGEGIHTPESILSVVSAGGQPLLPTVVERGPANKSRTPAMFPSEVKSFNSTNTTTSGNQPTIATPKEPSSLGEGSVGVSAGDPAGGANVVSAAKAAGRGLLESVGLGGNASASLRGSAPPAGYVDDDPRTAGVEVGDFKGLKEALESSKPSTGAGATDVEATTATTAAATDSTGASDLAPGVDAGALKDSATQAADSAKQSLSDAANRAREGVDSAMQAAKDATGMDTSSAAASSGTAATGSGGGLLSGLADLVSGIATKVNIATSSEEVLAGGVIPDAAAGPAAADGATAAQPAVGSSGSSVSDAAAAAKDSVSDAAAAAKEKASDAAAAVKEKASEAAEGVSSSMRVDDQVLQHTIAAQSAYDMVAGPDHPDRPDRSQANDPDSLISSLRVDVDQAGRPDSQADAGTGPDTLTDSLRLGGGRQQQQRAMDVYGTAGKDDAVQQGSLVQDAKEGFVGAYDAAAGAAASAADKVKENAAGLSGQGAQQGGPSGDQHLGSESGAMREAAGGGSGAASGPGLVASLKQGWEDLKHGGAPAPRAVSHAGETAASHDVTSNVERSKHLGDEQEKKIYDAEVYHVSPGAQAGSGAPASHAAKTGAIAGANKAVAGTTPHDKPDSYNVGADQKTRFDGNKGTNTGFGTGSAAPWSGHDSVKAAAEMFTSRGTLEGSSTLNMTPEQQYALVEAATQAGAAAAGGAGSSAEGGLRSWVSSMAAVWSNIGRAAAVGPTGKDVPTTFDNPTQNVMIDPVRGVTKTDSPTPGHKVQMRPAEQVPTGGNVDDPHLLQHKAERLGKVISDSLTTSSDDAAKDPDNLKGKSSDNKPDGTEYWLKHEAAEAAESLKAAPEKAAGALHTAGEIVTGVAGHIGHKIAHPFENEGAAQPGASQAVGGSSGKVGESIYGVSVGAGEARDAQDLQEKRMDVWASGEDPAKKRETLGDKVIGPLVGDVTDAKHAKELADSYHKYKAEKETGSAPSTGSHSQGAMTSTGNMGVDTQGASAAEMGNRVGAKASELANKAGAAAQSAADKAGAAAHDAADKAKGVAREGVDTAKATGDITKAEAEAGVDHAKRAAGAAGDKAHELTDKAAHKAHELGDKASQKAGELRDRAAETVDEAGARAQQTADEARDAAGRAGEQAGAAAGALLGNIVGGAKAVLGGLLGPFEKEGAFEETTAVVTGPAKNFEPVGAEQMTGREAAAAEASRASKAGAGNTGTAGATAYGGRGAAAPAGAEFKEGAEQTKEGIKQMGQAGIDKTAHAAGTVTGKAAAAKDAVADKAAHAKESVKATLQAGVDDTAHAAGLAVGHTEAAVENILEQVNAVKENVAEKVAEVTENIQVPPAEVPSNTEDIIRMKQQTV